MNTLKTDILVSLSLLYYPELQEQLDEVDLLMGNRFPERDVAEARPGVGVGAPLQQQARHSHRLRRTVHRQAVVQRRVASREKENSLAL